MGSADGKIYVYRWVALYALELPRKFVKWACDVLTTSHLFWMTMLFVVIDHHNSYFSLASD